MSLFDDFRQPLYEGKDVNLSDDWYCFTCSERGKLSKCSRCGVARYCSSKCQKENWSEHKSQCKELMNADAVIEREYEKLCHHTPWFGGGTENLFETSIGHFWEIMESRDYYRALFGKLVNCM